MNKITNGLAIAVIAVTLGQGYASAADAPNGAAVGTAVGGAVGASLAPTGSAAGAGMGVKLSP